MKLIKLACMAIVATLALGSYSAKAGVVRQFEKLNFSLTTMQQDLYNSSNAAGVYVYTTKTAKLTNKELLSFLATAFDTNWPADAQLALNLSDFDIYVVDKTGTNPILDLSVEMVVTNAHTTNTARFYVEPDDSVTAGKDVYKSSGNGNESSTDNLILYFELNRTVGTNAAAYTDLEFLGLDKAKYSASWIDDTSSKVSESDKAIVIGDGDINNKWTVVSGKVTGEMEKCSSIIIRAFL
jgi:hypothetical protein